MLTLKDIQLKSSFQLISFFLDKQTIISLISITKRINHLFKKDIYRKITENSVVLTEKEYIDLSRHYVKEQKKQAVKEFAEKLKEKYGHYWCYLCKKDLKQLRTIIDDLLKEYEK